MMILRKYHTYMYIYISINILELRVAGGIQRNAARFSGYWPDAHRIKAPALDFPASGIHFLDSDIRLPDSSLHSSVSSPKT